MLFHDSPLLVREPQEFELIETVPVLEAAAFKRNIFEGDSTPYDWEQMSVVEAGDDWDPQTSLVPIRKADLTETGLFNWSADTKPDGYELPSVYPDTVALDAAEQRYAAQFQHNPLAADE